VSLPELRRIYLVRHGVTAWNQAMRMQGQTDVPLAELGQEQAARIGRRMALMALPPQAVWSSDLSRARTTAEAIAQPLGLTVRTLPQLRETGFGVWEGLTRDEIVARGEGELLANYRLDPFHNRPPGSESLEEVWSRMIAAMEIIRADSGGAERIAVVGHGGSLRALICDALSAPITSMRHLFFENASLSIIEEKEGANGLFRRLLLFNDTLHLEEPSA
jgi:broad specificity phosphatase PhoE